MAGSLSKTYAMTGWRIGFGLVPPPIVQAMTKLQSHSTSNPCSISQKAAVEALRGPQESVGVMLAEYRKRRDFVVSRLRQIPGVTCNEPQGAFYVYPNVSVAFKNGIANTLQFAEKLLAEGHVAAVPGEAFGTDPPHSHLLRHLDEGTGARSRSHPPVRRPEFIAMQPAVRLTPSLREKVWGRTRLSPWYAGFRYSRSAKHGSSAPANCPCSSSGSSPTSASPSRCIPTMARTARCGKSEMWHILDAQPGASIAMGFREPLTRERLREATRTGEVEQLLHWAPVKPGETYLIPAHTVHAIGAGIVLCEIQQNSDVTYRLWDYGRPRELHVDKAVPLCDLGVHPGAALRVPLGEGREELVRAKHFVTERVQLRPGQSMLPEPQRSQLWICLEGSAEIGDDLAQAGEVWLLPDEGKQPAIAALAPATFLRTWAPWNRPAGGWRSSFRPQTYSGNRLLTRADLTGSRHTRAYCEPQSEPRP